MPKIITSKDVHLSYGPKEALHGISLDFEEHDITALIGPSGCGKSTYLRCLNRMNDLIKGVTITGSMKLEDEDIYAPERTLLTCESELAWYSSSPIRFHSASTKMSLMDCGWLVRRISTFWMSGLKPA